MGSLETASHIGLWLLVLMELGLIVALARVVGTALERFGTAAALTTAQGLSIGSVAPDFELSDVRGKLVILGTPIGRETFLLFTATNCPMCANILPNLGRFVRSEKVSMDMILMARGNDSHKHERNKKVATELGLPYVIADEIFNVYQVATVPYGILVDKEGIIRAKGLVNSVEQIESLVEYKEMTMDGGIKSAGRSRRQAGSRNAGTHQQAEHDRQAG